MNKEDADKAGLSAPALTRSDVERLCDFMQSTVEIDLHQRDLRGCDLSYMDLRGVNLQGADLQGANLRGTNLSGANLQGANLSGADMDGANLSRARLGHIDADRVHLSGAKLSYAILRGLDLRDFDLSELDLQCADLNESDLRGAVLKGTHLQGADLSTARLNGPELRGAILHRNTFADEREGYPKHGGRRIKIQASNKQETIMPLEEHAAFLQEEQSQPLTFDREAYLLGEQAPLVGFDAKKLHELFPQGFTFAQARHIFDNWLVQMGSNYDETTVQAMWIGFAHRICDLYYESNGGA